MTHDQHARRVDGARAAAGPGRRDPRLDRRLSDPARGAGRAARQLPFRRLTACRRSARRSSPATATSRRIRRSCKKFIAASLKGWSFALDNPDEGGQGPEGRLSRSEREAGRGRARRDHAAVLQRRREVHRQGRGRACGRRRQELLSRGQAAARRPGPEDATTRTTTCRRRRRCAPASR